ncbi:fibronectin type III domain-containing protein [Candidatus Riflebacteria bacterium]
MQPRPFFYKEIKLFKYIFLVGLPFCVLLGFFAGCGDSIDRRVLESEDRVNIRGSLKLDQLNINSDLLFGFNAKIKGKVLSDLSVFRVTLGDRNFFLNKDGTFYIKDFKSHNSYRLRVYLDRNPNLVFEKLIEDEKSINGELEVEVNLRSTAVAALLDAARNSNRKIEESDLNFNQIQTVVDAMMEQIERQPQNFSQLGIELKSIPDVSKKITDIIIQFTSEGGDTPKTDFTKPVISNLLYEVFTNSVLVTWQTDEPATSQVRYGTGSSTFPIITPVDPELVTNHSVVLTRLEQDVFYYFTVSSEDRDGNESFSEPLNFIISSGASRLYKGLVFNRQFYDFGNNTILIIGDSRNPKFTVLDTSPKTVRVEIGDNVDWRIQRNDRIEFLTTYIVESRAAEGWNGSFDLAVNEIFAFVDPDEKRGVARITAIFDELVAFEYIYPLETEKAELASGTVTFTRVTDQIASESFDVSTDSFKDSRDGNLNVSALVAPKKKPFFNLNSEPQLKWYMHPKELIPIQVRQTNLPTPIVVDSSKLQTGDVLLLENHIYHFQDDEGRFGAFRVIEQSAFDGASGTGILKLDWLYQKQFLEGSKFGSQFLEE